MSLLSSLRGRRPAAADAAGAAVEAPTTAPAVASANATAVLPALAPPADAVGAVAVALRREDDALPTPDPPAPANAPTVRERGQLRRRARFLRTARELDLRDLGGLVFELHRAGGGVDASAAALLRRKLARMEAADRELRALEAALDERRPLAELREPGVGGTCASCGTLLPSQARFCSHCAAPATAGGPSAQGSDPRPVEPEPELARVPEADAAAPAR